MVGGMDTTASPSGTVNDKRGCTAAPSRELNESTAPLKDPQPSTEGTRQLVEDPYVMAEDPVDLTSQVAVRVAVDNPAPESVVLVQERSGQENPNHGSAVPSGVDSIRSGDCPPCDAGTAADVASETAEPSEPLLETCPGASCSGVPADQGTSVPVASLEDAVAALPDFSDAEVETTCADGTIAGESGAPVANVEVNEESAPSAAPASLLAESSVETSTQAAPGVETSRWAMQFPSILSELGLRVTKAGIVLPESHRSYMTRRREAFEMGAIVPKYPPITEAGQAGEKKKRKPKAKKPWPNGAPLDDLSAALHRAALTGDVEGCQAAVEAGVDINVRTNADTDGLGIGATALHIAALRGHEDVVKTMLALKADCTRVTGRGEGALQLAIRGGHVEVVRLLRHVAPDAEGVLRLLDKAPAWDDKKRKRLHSALDRRRVKGAWSQAWSYGGGRWESPQHQGGPDGWEHSQGRDVKEEAMDEKEKENEDEDASSSKWSGSWREQEVASHDGENRWEGGGWHSWGEQADSRRSRSRESRPQRWLESESKGGKDNHEETGRGQNRDKGKDSFDKVEGKGNTDGSDVWPRDHRDREFLALTSDTPPISERGSSGRQRTRKGGKGCKGW